MENVISFFLELWQNFCSDYIVLCQICFSAKEEFSHNLNVPCVSQVPVCPRSFSASPCGWSTPGRAESPPSPPNTHHDSIGGRWGPSALAARAHAGLEADAPAGAVLRRQLPHGDAGHRGPGHDPPGRDPHPACLAWVSLLTRRCRHQAPAHTPRACTKTNNSIRFVKALL